MKRVVIHSVGLFVIAMTTWTSSGFGKTGPQELRFKGATLDAIEKSLAVALRTPSPEVQASASQVVRDLKGLLPDQDFSMLIIPLMAIVKNEDADVPSRMVAALALYDLQSAKGDFAIERVAEFTQNDRMKHLCTWLTYDRMLKSPPASKTTAALIE